MGKKEPIDEATQKFRSFVAEGSMNGVSLILQAGGGPQRSVEFIIQAISAAMMVAAPIIANCERKHTHEEITPEFTERQMRKASRPEVMVFVGLLSAYLIDEARFTGDSGGVGADISTSSGPDKLWLALEAWQKIYPDKSADDYFDASMLEAARDAGKGSVVPLNEFLAKRAQSLRGNNSIN